MSPENAAENENAAGHSAPASGPPAARRQAWIVLAALGAVLLIVLLVALVWRVGDGVPRAGDTTGNATGNATVTPTPTKSPDATEPPPTGAPTQAPTANPEPAESATAAPGQTAAPGVPRPTSCTQLYSPEMVQALGDLALNPEWSEDPDSGVAHGTDDAELRVQIDALDHLTCVWASPYGGSDTGIITNVVWVTPEQSAAVEDGLVANGLECFTQSEGRRCVIQTNTVDGAFGESHFLRNGIWLATKYTNAGPLGYTQDIINNLWMRV